MTFLYILLGLIALLCLLLFSDIRIRVIYGDNPSFRVGYLFFHYPLQHTKQPKPPKKPGKPQPEKPAQKEPPIRLEFVLRLLKEAVDLLGRLVAQTRIRPCKVRILVAEEDAAETAISYGRYCALLGLLEALLKASFKKVSTDFAVGWNFEPEQTGTKVDFRLVLRLRLIWVVLARFWKPLMLLAELKTEPHSPDKEPKKK